MGMLRGDVAAECFVYIDFGYVVLLGKSRLRDATPTRTQVVKKD